MKIGLVLEGGGMRALYSCGVMDVMMQEGIAFDGLIGVSAGALFGVNYKSQQPGRGLRYNLALQDDPNYMGWRPLLRTGNVVNAQFAYHEVPFTMDCLDAETYKHNPMAFWLVCTDIETGEAVFHEMPEFTHEEVEWLRASASMPLVSRPVQIGGRVLLDGGMVNSIPLYDFQQMGYERNVVVLTQPKGYRKHPTWGHYLLRVACRQYPRIAELMRHRYLMYNRQLDYVYQQAREGKILLLQPDSPLGIGRVERNGDKMQTVYQRGYNDALRHREDMLHFLTQGSR